MTERLSAHLPDTHGLEETPIGEYVDFQNKRNELVVLPYDELVKLSITHEYARVIIAERKKLGAMKAVELIRISLDTTDPRQQHAELILRAKRLKEIGEQNVFFDTGYNS